jgi:hypothetical protein
MCLLFPKIAEIINARNRRVYAGSRAQHVAQQQDFQ